MKRLLLALGIILAGSSAYAGNYPPTPNVVQPFAPQEIPTKFRELVSNINTYAPGALFSLPTVTTATAAATTQTLASWTLPANTFTTTGQALRIKGVFVHAANTNNITPILTFGTYTLTGTINATSAGTEHLECLVVRSGLNTQNITCAGMTQVTPIINSYAAGSSTETGDIAITGQCTQGSASADCSLATFIVEAVR